MGEHLIFIRNILIIFSELVFDCEDVRDIMGGETGVYTIYLTDDEDKVHAVNVSCIMEPDVTYTVSAATCPNSI